LRGGRHAEFLPELPDDATSSESIVGHSSTVRREAPRSDQRCQRWRVREVSAYSTPRQRGAVRRTDWRRHRWTMKLKSIPRWIR